jgi:hypothetical protein
MGEKTLMRIVAGDIIRMTNLCKDRVWKTALFDKQIDSAEKPFESAFRGPS